MSATRQETAEESVPPLRLTTKPCAALAKIVEEPQGDGASELLFLEA